MQRVDQEKEYAWQDNLRLKKFKNRQKKVYSPHNFDIRQIA